MKISSLIFGTALGAWENKWATMVSNLHFNYYIDKLYFALGTFILPNLIFLALVHPSAEYLF